MITLNPFDIEKNIKKNAKNAFFRIESIYIGEELKIERHIYFTTMGNVCRKVGKEYFSPLITEKEAVELQGILSHIAKSNFYFWWTTIIASTFITLMPLYYEKIPLPIILTTMLIINGYLMFKAFNETVSFTKKSKEWGNMLWSRDCNIIVPAACRKRALIKSLKSFAGPVSSSILSEAVSMSGNDTIKLTYGGLELGSEVIKLSKKHNKSIQPTAKATAD